MEFVDNYSISFLFISKTITITCDSHFLQVCVPSVRRLYEDSEYNRSFHLLTSSAKQLQRFFIKPVTSGWDALNLVLFDLGKYEQYRPFYNAFLKFLQDTLPNVDVSQHRIQVGSLIITEEIWDYILYLLKLSCGEKIEKPRIFSSEEEKAFYLAQKEFDERIQNLRQQNQKQESDGLSKLLLSIVYSFPSFTIDYLLDQTMAQILWLQKHAAGAVSYEVNAQAFAAGNMKKGTKLDFFIK